jgi:hypothetical protein
MGHNLSRHFTASAADRRRKADTPVVARDQMHRRSFPLAFSHCTASVLTVPASRQIVVEARNCSLTAAAGTREAAMLVKNILVGKRGYVVTIEPIADLTAAANCWPSDASVRS